MGRARDLYDHLIKSGEDGIAEIIDESDPWTEHLFVDYKRSRRQKEVGPVHEDDRRNLAKAISGFGNSSGGLIVWGVKCKKGADGVDIPTKAAPLKEVVRFRSQLEGLISGLTIPAHDGVENETIVVSDDGDGYLLTYIPKNDYAPLRSLKHDQYFWRSGSSFQSVSHDALAGMFGKRPAPRLKLLCRPGRALFESETTLMLERTYSVRNDGIAVVKDFFVTFELVDTVGSSSAVNIHPCNNIRQYHGPTSRIISLVAEDDFRLAPGVLQDVYILQIRLRSPVESNLDIRVHYGCEGSRVFAFQYTKDIAFFEKVYNFGLGNWDPRRKHSWQYHTETRQPGLDEANRDAFDTTIDIPLLT